jgi:hypothetical protein
MVYLVSVHILDRVVLRVRTILPLILKISFGEEYFLGDKIRNARLLCRFSPGRRFAPFLRERKDLLGNLHEIAANAK